MHSSQQFVLPRSAFGEGIITSSFMRCSFFCSCARAVAPTARVSWRSGSTVIHCAPTWSPECHPLGLLSFEQSNEG